MFRFSDEQLALLIGKVFRGEVTEDDLPENLYYEIADFLKRGLYDGFGGSLTDFKEGSKELELLQDLRDNVYFFSAAKTYTQIREMSDALIDEDGNYRTFNEFKQIANQIFDTYNLDYLKTEHTTAISSAQMGAKWIDIENNKGVLPYLKMSVVEDDNTTEICEPLDGICLPVDDDFWDDYYPPNHWNCRSTVEQLDDEDGKKELSSESRVDKATEHADEHMQDEFKMNVGRDGVIFKSDHPYFADAPKELGKKNFGLKIPETDNEE